MKDAAHRGLQSEWLRATGLDDPGAFGLRLKWDGLDDATAASVFGRSPRSVEDAAQRIRQLLADSAPITADESHAGLPTVAFVELWQRLARGARERLVHRGVEAGPDVLDDMESHLIERLAEVGERVLWEEFRRRRSPEQVVFAHLGRGESAAGPRREIYLAFVEHLRVDALHGLITSYPVLGQHLVTVIDQWLRQMGQMLDRFSADKSSLCEDLGLPADAVLTRVRLGCSDPHRGGQMVAVLEVAGTSASEGDSAHVVYKPKDLAIDLAFQQLLGDLPRPRSGDSALGGLRVAPRDGYGWMEYVGHATSATEQDLACFYRNAGRLLAVLHVLAATDCHHENLVASGDLLHLVDGEALLCGYAGSDDGGLQTRIAQSVTAVGMLPQWHLFGRERVPHDVTGLGVVPPPEDEISARGWNYINTDAMFLGEVFRRLPVPTSSPVGAGQPNRLADFTDELVSGFAEQLAAVVAERGSWLGRGGHLDRFRGLDRRVILRPTWIYLWLRQQQLEAHALTSPLRQRLVLETLARSYVTGEGRRKDWPLFGEELDQMAVLDIPFFQIDVDGRDLQLANGSDLTGYLQRSGLQTARTRVEQLDEQEIAFQVQLVRGAVLSRDLPRPHARSSTDDELPLPELSARDEVQLIADHLVETAFDYEPGSAEWLGSEVLADLETYRFGPLGHSLYSGRAGVALFLTAASRVGLPRSAAYLDLARRAISELRVLASAPPNALESWWREQPLGLAGVGGVILGLTLAEELSPGLFPSTAWSHVLAACRPAMLEEDDRLDVVFGVAGLVGPLLRLGTEEALELAANAGDVLVRRQARAGGWHTLRGRDNSPLSGFSHGASGCATALAALYDVTGEARLGAAARRALDWERTTFDPSTGAWSDLRPRAAHTGGATLGWCHGAPGIALARLCIRSTSLHDDEVDEDLGAALVASSARDATPSLDSVCCGRLGRATILAAAQRRGSAVDDSAAGSLVAEVFRGRLRRGDYNAIRSPGLFQGLAGAGLAMLESGTATGGVLEAVLSTGILR